jgi:hypothetical protein
MERCYEQHENTRSRGKKVPSPFKKTETKRLKYSIGAARTKTDADGEPKGKKKKGFGYVGQIGIIKRKKSAGPSSLLVSMQL